MSTIDAADVIRQQADLRDHFRNPEFIKLVTEQFADTLKAPEGGKRMFRTMHSYLDVAKSYRVEQQMTPVIMDRARALPDDARSSEPPCQFGFCVLEEPIHIIDTHGREEIIHVINWAPTELNFQDGSLPKKAYMVATWNDIYREPDQVWREDIERLRQRPDIYQFIQASGRWSLVAARPIPLDWPMGPFELNDIKKTAEAIKVIVPELPDELVSSDNYEGKAKTSFNVLRVLSSLFDMLGERIPKTSRAETNEPTRLEKKQAKREGLDPEVITVCLRPEYDPDKVYREGTGRKQLVRSKVGNPELPGDIAYYRTIHRGTPRERQVPVRAHYRGPEDGPPPPPKVHTLSR